MRTDSNELLDSNWAQLLEEKLHLTSDFEPHISQKWTDLVYPANNEPSNQANDEPGGLNEAVRQRQSSLSNIRVAPLRIRKYGSSRSSLESSREAGRTNGAPDTPPHSAVKERFGTNNFWSHSRNTSISSHDRSESLSKANDHFPETPSSEYSTKFEMQHFRKHSNQSFIAVPSLSESTRISNPSSFRALEKMRRRHNCARELYNTEWQFAQDMAVIVRIYMCGSANVGLSVRQIDMLFSNVSQVLDVSLSLVAILESYIPYQILEGTGDVGLLDTAADPDLMIGKAMCLALTGQLYEVYENYIHRSQSQMRLYYRITQELGNHPQKHEAGATESPEYSTENIDKEKLVQWLTRCRTRVSKFTTAWSLDSLLIKPIQRLGKYPLLLKTLLECTDIHHQDYENLERAYNRSKHYLDCVNARFDVASS